MSNRSHSNQGHIGMNALRKRNELHVSKSLSPQPKLARRFMYEEIAWFAKTRKYYFNLDAVRIPS
jgi:hypothetical protein